MTNNKIKYKIVLPKFETWYDLHELLSEEYTWDTVDEFIETLKHLYPHGVRIGDKYIQK